MAHPEWVVTRVQRVVVTAPDHREAEQKGTRLLDADDRGHFVTSLKAERRYHP